MNTTATVEITQITISGETAYTFRDAHGVWVTAITAGESWTSQDESIKQAEIWLDQHQVPSDYDDAKRAAEELDALATEIGYAQSFRDPDRMARAIAQTIRLDVTSLVVA